ncbi:RNA polymerase sigma factor [Silvibacterium dinghuense]|uniref:RNA polymerase sigma factor n=1 Tax=Silvibacterium dinghuense TaxID=1560006 RepID=A0A4V1NV22_9BACT|nr:RNA polymerase sigma factor [Silvibacterium dinghuense]RXS94252.1 RNA polymerase sigma factor [Silvibacterium dinghuense]GGH17431.1 hypothetical protein GCM10011586_39940 [Silvibacterium dinghuense]
MRLVHPRLPDSDSGLTLESLFAAKYTWLLRWALHFSHNDRAQAEDLVQETFVRILNLRGSIDGDNIEALLYTQLRFAYLTERRRNHLLQNLDVVDFDTLTIGLRTFSTLDQMQVQNDLRRILEYLLWRRRAAKFASFFLLRFFHGFAVDEVAAICRVTRNAIDLGLRNAREELKSYLADPARMQVLGRGAAPEVRQLNSTLSSPEFADALIESIFAASCGHCPATELERRYAALNAPSLDIDLLAHIVSCRACLEKIRRIGAAPPDLPASSSMETGRRRSRSKRSLSSEKDILARIFTHGRERMREIFYHDPSELVMVLNGEVAAVRDISSARAILKVEARSIEKLELIEIFSEQGLLMLMLPVTEHPPQASPELSSGVVLSRDRNLRLSLRFTAEGALIEAHYFDPQFGAVFAGNENFTPRPRQDDESPAELKLEDVRKTDRSQLQQIWTRLRNWLYIQPLIPVSAIVLLAAGLAIWQHTTHPEEQIQVSAMLNDSVRAERQHRIAHGPGIVHQSVEIHSSRGIFHHDLYRDIDGRRRPRPQSINSAEKELRDKLADAGLEWNDPLSVAGFEAWRDHIAGEQDSVAHTAAGLITVTTHAPSGPVLSESVTLRLSDLHPVARSLVYRDQETIQIAELSYEVLPWDARSEQWFEPLSSRTTISHPITLPQAYHPATLTTADLDVTELAAMLALQQLNAETERLEIVRSVGGVTVKGIVATNERKQEIASRLRLIPHVSVEIRSYQDLASEQSASSAPTEIKAVSVSSEVSPLDDDCVSQHLTQDRCRQLAYILLETSAALGRENHHLDELQRQYPDIQMLSPGARTLLAELTRLHVLHLLSAVHEQIESFPTLGFSSQSSPADTIANLSNAVERDQLLTRELVYARDEHSRSAALILQDLATSAAAVQAAASNFPASHPDQQDSSLTDIKSPHQ